MCILDLKYLLRSNPKWQSRPKSTPQDLILTKKQESKSSWYCSQEICADVSGCKVLLKALVFPGVARGKHSLIWLNVLCLIHLYNLRHK